MAGEPGFLTVKTPSEFLTVKTPSVNEIVTQVCQTLDNIKKNGYKPLVILMNPVLLNIFKSGFPGYYSHHEYHIQYNTSSMINEYDDIPTTADINKVVTKFNTNGTLNKFANVPVQTCIYISTYHIVVE